MYEISYQLSDIDMFPEIPWICLRNSLSMKFLALKTVSAWAYPPKTRMQFKTANSQVKGLVKKNLYWQHTRRQNDRFCSRSGQFDVIDALQGM